MGVEKETESLIILYLCPGDIFTKTELKYRRR